MSSRLNVLKKFAVIIRGHFYCARDSSVKTFIERTQSNITVVDYKQLWILGASYFFFCWSIGFYVFFFSYYKGKEMDCLRLNSTQLHSTQRRQIPNPRTNLMRATLKLKSNAKI